MIRESCRTSSPQTNSRSFYHTTGGARGRFGPKGMVAVELSRAHVANMSEEKGQGENGHVRDTCGLPAGMCCRITMPLVTCA